MILHKKVLIVDDDYETRQLVRKVLNKLDSVEFLEAGNGEEAIEITRDQRPDIILMDILMPGIDGYEACRRIKSDPLLKSTIIIFMTAVPIDEISDKIIQVHGDDLLRKPLDASELFFRVRNYLSLIVPTENDFHGNAESMKILTICDDEKGTLHLGNDYLYQSEIKCLCKHNHFIPLMQQEILLLEELIRYKNRVATYDQLLHAISKNGESSLANLRTLIKLLRRKTYKELIHTLPSVGYRLVISNNS